MDRTGDFSCFSFLFVYILPSSSHLSPPLTFSSAEPTLNDFMFFLLFFFLKNKKIKMKKVRQSSLTTPGALKAPFTAVLRRFQSLLLNLFLHRFLFFFFLTINTANIIIEKKILRAQWRLSLDCCHIGPWLTKTQGDSGSDGTLLSPQEALRAALLPSPLFPLRISAATGLFSPSQTPTYQLLSPPWRTHFLRLGHWEARGGSHLGNLLAVDAVTSNP